MAEKFVEGMLVELPPKPELGVGKVLKVNSEKLYVFFKNQPSKEAMIFKLSNNKLALSLIREDPILNHLPPFVEQQDGKMILTSKAKRWTLQQTFEVFQTRCPLGFKDPRYLDVERNYKWHAHEKFADTLGNSKGQKLLAGGNIQELVQKALSVTSKVNLLSPYENMALHDALQNEEAAKKFFTSLFAVLDSPLITEAVYQPYVDAVLDLPQETGKARVGTWPVVTLLPFIAQPDRHMFLKPSNTQSAAEALAFDLRYQSQPNWKTYEALLEMGAIYFQEVQHLGPRDFIDVQSFIWVAGHGV